MNFAQSIHQRGLSLIEMMVGIALGMIIIAALTGMVVNTSRTRAELAKTSQQIENGRYAIQVMVLDLHHAGFFGELYSPSLDATVAPADPCRASEFPNVNQLQYPVQATLASSFWPYCGRARNSAGATVTITPDANTEVLAIRRADRVAVCPGGSVTTNDWYIQATSDAAVVEKGNSTAFKFGTTSPAGTDATLCKIVYNNTAMLDPDCGVHIAANAGGLPCASRTAATIRKYNVNVYFVAPYNDHPTLQRLVLGVNGFTVEPLVEGIETIQFEYGVDSDSASFGIPDQYKKTVDMTATDWQNVVAVRVSVLARNLEATPGYSDNKTYTLGSYVSTPDSRGAANNAFKRHVFSSTVSLYNPAGRRVLP